MSQTADADDPLIGIDPAATERAYALMHATSPLYWSRAYGGWIAASYRDVDAVLRNPDFLTDDPSQRLGQFVQRGGPKLDNFRAALATIPFFMNSPRHDRVRRFLSKVFHGLDYAAMRAELEAYADQLLQAGRKAGEIDLATGYAREIALCALRFLLGIPMRDCRDVAERAREVALFFDVAPHPLREMVAADAKIGELIAYFRRLVAERRSSRREDGLSAMIDLASRELAADEAEIAGYCAFFFVAGEESTAAGVARASVMLLERPDIRQRLSDDARLIPAAAEEYLRLVSPFQYVTRIAAKDIALGDVTVARGQSVTVLLGGANHDPRQYPDPDAIELERKGPENLAFGVGAHSCLGAKMATLEMEVALSALARCPDIRLGPSPPAPESRLRVPALISAQAVFGAAAAGAPCT